MKKLLLILLLFVAVTSSAATVDTITIFQKNTTWINSLPGGSRMEFTLNAACPQGKNEAFNTAFDKWLGEGIVVLFPAVTGNGSMLLSQMEQAYCSTREKTVSAINKSKSGKRYEVVLDASVTREQEKSSYITFKQDLVYYPVEGTRQEVVKENTFLKPSGKSLSWKDVVNTKKQAQFNKVLISAIGGFFGVKDLANLKGRLLNGDKITTQNFPLPADGPAFEGTGIRVVYGAGEIAPAEYGYPSALIPYSAVSSYLTTTAKKLIK